MNSITYELFLRCSLLPRQTHSSLESGAGLAPNVRTHNNSSNSSLATQVLHATEGVPKRSVCESQCRVRGRNKTVCRRIGRCNEVGWTGRTRARFGVVAVSDDQDVLLRVKKYEQREPRIAVYQLGRASRLLLPACNMLTSLLIRLVVGLAATQAYEIDEATCGKRQSLQGMPEKTAKYAVEWRLTPSQSWSDFSTKARTARWPCH